MAIGRKHVDMDFCFKNAVDKSMLSCDFSAPSPFGLLLQWLRVTQPCLRMVVKLADKPQSLIVSLRLIFKKFSQVGQCFFLDDDRVIAPRLRMYLSSSSTLAKRLPGCCSARSIFAKNSSFVMSVESCFSFTNFLAYRVRRFISGSQSAMAPMLCHSSVFIALSCTAVIISNV